MNTWIRRGVVSLTALGTVVGSLALSAPTAGAVVPAPNPPTNLTVYKQGTSTASATALDVLDVAIVSDTSPNLPINTADGNPRLKFTKTGNRTVYVAVTATGAKTGTAVLPVLPEVGEWYVNLLVNNVVDGGLNFTYTVESWTCASGEPATDGTNRLCEERFAASGTWTVPTGVTSADFLVVGGGGGGGGGLAADLGNIFGAGAGGGGGAVTVCSAQVVTPNDQWTVVVGSGGTAGTLRNGGNAAASPGSNGQSSSITHAADTCTGAGGTGGQSAGNGLEAGSGGPSRTVHVRPGYFRGGFGIQLGGDGGASGNSKAGGTGANSLYFGTDRTIAGGGGGGSGTAGSNGSASPVSGGAGGAGTNPTGAFADLVYTFGGGGGGGAGDGDATNGQGGLGWYGGGNGGTCSFVCGGGGGGSGFPASSALNAPQANSGGGGGGGTGSSEGLAADGADGIVIVRYQASGGGGGSTPDCINSLTPADIYTTTQDCVVPAGVTKISIVIVGGGGGGGKGSANAGGGGGGGGAGNLCADIQVTPGETLSLTVGAGGSGDSGSGASDGGTSTAVSASSVNPLCEAPGGKKGVLDGGAAGTGSLGGTASPAAGGGGGGSSFPGDAANGTSAGNGGAGFFVIPVGGGGGGGSVGGQPGQGQAGGGNGSADATCAADAAGTANSGGGGGGGTPDCNGGAGGGGFVALQFAPTPSCIDGDFGYTFDFYSQTGGSYSCAVPAGKQTVDILVVGGGGGGGYGDTDSGSAGGGGGGGEVKVCSGIPVTPGDTLDLSVGSPGGGGAKDVAGTTPASAGGASTVMSGASKLCEALGGAAGQSAGEGFPGSGGGSGSSQAGGAAVLNGQIVTAGGGGGGASSAGSAGSGLCGGAGGAGQAVSQLATPGLFSTVSYVFGGGGGGGSTVPNNTAPVQHPPCDSQLGGLGGTGGGGDGAPTAVWPGQLAADSTGGGGGGGSPTYCAPGGSPCGNGGGAAAGYVELRFSPAYVLKECALTSDNADGDQAVSLIDIATDSLDGGPTALDSSPYPAVLSPSGTRAYVAVSGYVKILDTVSRTVLSQILIDNNVVSLAISPDGSTLYVSTGFGIVVVDVRTKVATPLDAPLMASQQIVLSPDGTKLYTYDSISGKVVTINTSDETVVARPSASTLTSGGQTYSSAMAISRDGTKLYLGFDDNATGQIAVVDTTDSSLVKYVSLGASPAPSGLAVGADGTVYATNTNDSLVLAVDPSSQGSNVLRTISVSIAPQAIAASPTGTKLFVGHGGYQAVTPIDISTPSAPVAGIDLSTVANDITAGYCVDANNAPTGTGRVWIERDLGSGGVPVDTNGALDLTVSCENPTYTSITAAVAAAQANDIIHVCSGTYREDEIVPTVDNLTIQGTEWVDPSTAPSPGPGRPASRHVGATLTDPVIIDGEATEGDSSTRHRIFDATDLNITFKDVVLQNGSSDTYGGAVKAYQAVFVDSTVQDNTAPGGGAVYVSGEPTCDTPVARLLPGIRTVCAPTSAFGPLSQPSVAATDSEFLRNGVAHQDQAPTPKSSAYLGGSIDGGAIYANDGLVVVTDSTFDANEATALGDPAAATDGAGGAILADSAEIYGSTFTSNKALCHGGAVLASSVIVDWNSNEVGSTFENNEATSTGTCADAAKGDGGAIWTAGAVVKHSTFTTNTAQHSGGAIALVHSVDPNAIVWGQGVTADTLVVDSVTFDRNAAVDEIGNFGGGGAIRNYAQQGTVTSTNSTYSANTGGTVGGAIWSDGSITLSFNTFDGNTAGALAGTYFVGGGETATTANNIFVFQGSASDCFGDLSGADSGSLTTDGACPGTVTTEAELALGELADNGGPTQTMAIPSTSAAVDAAVGTDCPDTVAVDQRGNTRPVGDGCDVGAYEYFGQVTLDAPPGQEGSFTSESGVKTLHILLIGGGGGGGSYGPNGEAGGGGGGGEVVECTIDLTVSATEVHYYFGLGGAEGEDGEDSKVWTTDEANPECFAAGGKAGVQGGTSAGAGAGGNAGGSAGLGGDAALCAAPATCTGIENQSLAGGGGGGAGGGGADGSFDSSTLSAVGGAGGVGVAPSSVAFGDTSQLYGGGGGGGAYCASDSSGGEGGTGGGGIGASGECVRRPVRGNPPSYGGGPVGGGGGGGAGTIPGGSGGGGTGEVRTPAPLPPGSLIHVCVHRTSVTYGYKLKDLDVDYCIPVGECFVAPPTSGGGSTGPTGPSGPSGVTGPISPVSGSDPNHGCCTSGGGTTGPSGPTGPISPVLSHPEGCCTSGGGTTGPSGPSGATGPGAPVSGSDPGHSCCPAPVAPAGLQGPVSGSDPNHECCPTSGPVGSDDPNHCTPAAPVDSDPVPASPSVSGSLFGPMSADGTVLPTDSPDLVYSEQAQQWVGSVPTADGPSAPDATAPVTSKKKDGLPDGYYEIEPEKIEELYGIIPPDCTVDYAPGDPVTVPGPGLPITCTGGDPGSYMFDYSLVDAQEFNVLPAELKVKPNEVKVSFGDPVPTYSFKVRGFKLRETPDTADGWLDPVCTSTYTDTTPAGTKLDITCSGGGADNYVFKYETGRLEVRKKKIRLAPQDRTVTYGDPAPSYGFTLAPLDSGMGRVPDRLDQPQQLAGFVAPVCSSSYAKGTSAGKVAITCTGGGADNYEFDTSTAGTLTVLKAPLTVRPRNVTVTYGSAVPSYGYDLSGLVNGDTGISGAGSQAPKCSSAYSPTAAAGTTLLVTCTGGVSNNYSLDLSSTATLTVAKAKLTVTPDTKALVYGSPAPVYSYKVSGFVNGESPLTNPAGYTAPSCSSAYAPTVPAGSSVAISCTGGSASNYTVDTSATAAINVGKAVLSVVPDAKSVVYGSAAPSYTATVTGFVNGESAAVLSVQPVCTSAYTSATNVGTVAITCSGGTSGNYAFDTTAKGTLTVTKAPLTVTADAKSVVYGSAAPSYTYAVSGFVNGQSAATAAGYSAPSCSSVYSRTTPAGQVSITCSGGSASNYSFTVLTPGTLTVTKAPLTVTADAKSVTYGSAAPSYTATVSGFVNGESASVLSAQPTCTSAYNSATPAGSVAITCSGGSASNYSLAFQSGTLTVNKAVLKATPASASVVYGSAAPTVGVTVTGFVNGQSATTAAGYKAPTCSAAGYTMASNVGSYGITCAAGSATNYSFDLSASSLLTVTKAAATLTADAKSVVYGSAAPAYTFTLSGLKNGQTAATVAGLVAPVCSSAYSPLTGVGSVAISCSGASSTNYSFTYAAGAVSVTKAPLTVTPNSLTITKGTTATYTYTLSGFVNGQTSSALSAQPTCTSSYTTRSAAGTYTITCSGGSAANYAFTYKTATLTAK